MLLGPYRPGNTESNKPIPQSTTPIRLLQFVITRTAEHLSHPQFVNTTLAIPPFQTTLPRRIRAKMDDECSPHRRGREAMGAAGCIQRVRVLVIATRRMRSITRGSLRVGGLGLSRTRRMLACNVLKFGDPSSSLGNMYLVLVAV